MKREQGDLGSADRLYRDALAIASEHFPEDHNLFGYFYLKVSRLLETRGNLEAAVATSRQAIRILESTVGGSLLLEELVHLADLLRQMGDLERADSAVERALRLIRDRKEESFWMTREAKSVRGAIYSAQGRREEAEPLLVEGFVGLREVCGDRSSWTRHAHARLVAHFEAGGQDELAEETRALLPMSRP